MVFNSFSKSDTRVFNNLTSSATIIELINLIKYMNRYLEWYRNTLWL